MSAKGFFVESLSVKTWCLEIWPFLFSNRQKRPAGNAQCYIVDGSRLGMAVARATAWVTGTSVNRINLRARDARDERGVNLFLRILCHDLADVQQASMRGKAYQEFVTENRLEDLQQLFLARAIAGSPLGQTSLLSTLLLIQACIASSDKTTDKSTDCLLFLGRRPWGKTIEEYASKYGISVKFVSETVGLRAVLRRRLPKNAIYALRSLRHSRLKNLFFLSPNQTTPRSESGNGAIKIDDLNGIASNERPQMPKVATEHYGQLNLGNPELHSDLFFLEGSRLQGDDVIMTFSSPAAELNQPKLEAMRRHGIGAVVRHVEATTIPNFHITRSSEIADGKSDQLSMIGKQGSESRWLREQISRYEGQQTDWKNLFAENNVKVFLTWYKNDTGHIPAAGAIQALGGIAAIYQRSNELHKSAMTTTAADIIFTYSKLETEAFRLSDSSASYYVTTGYLGDHRFDILRESAQALRNNMMQNGAEKIIALFDESYREGSILGLGYDTVRSNYRNLLQKVIDNRWFGLVIKPKQPLSIRRWLGPVAELLQRAESTGRCHVYEETDGIHGAHSPAQAALSADVAVHTHLWPGTAGMEAAFANVPSLLLDTSGWPESPLYRLGEGNVVFTSMDDLWEACVRNWSTPGAIPDFGQWTPLLDELDPFRDGRAAERLGDYVKCLLDGFRDCQERGTVMANAAELYADRWGSDKITQG